MDIALLDLIKKNKELKIEELELKLKNVYKNIKNKNNKYINCVINDYENYFKMEDEIKEKKREALENILEHIEKINRNDNEIKKISNELKKLF